MIESFLKDDENFVKDPNTMGIFKTSSKGSIFVAEGE